MTRLVGLDGDNDAGLCEVKQNGNNWQLRAAFAGGNGQAQCRAVCILFGAADD